MRYLVVGGAGFIGSHIAKLLVSNNHEVVTLDNLSTGFEDSVIFGELVVGDLADHGMLNSLFAKMHFDGVLHFARSSQVAESLENSSKYYRNNVSNTVNILDVMIKHDVKHLVFSSTAAVYGEPNYLPIDENHPCLPMNPYGATKLMVERILKDYASAYGLQSVSRRYFNAARADESALLGERHDPEIHLIPLVLQAASGRRNGVTVYGRDYATKDGTCVRDFIHVKDLCSAHLLAMAYIDKQFGPHYNAFNLGYGHGFSIQEVLNSARMVVEKDNKNFTVSETSRRIGDPASLVADSARAGKTLGWKHGFKQLDKII